MHFSTLLSAIQELGEAEQRLVEARQNPRLVGQNRQWCLADLQVERDGARDKLGRTLDAYIDARIERALQQQTSIKALSGGG